MRKAFDVAFIAFGFACDLFLVCLIPRIVVHSGAWMGVAVAVLSVICFLGGLAATWEYRTKGKVNW